MKILIPTADYPPIEGGIGTLTLQVSRELAVLGHEVTVVAPWFPGMKEFDRNEPVRVVRYPGYNLGWLRLAPLFGRTMPHLIGTDRILATNVAYAGVIAWLVGQPCVTLAYGYEFLKFRPRSLPGRLLGRVYSRSMRVVAISRYTRDRLVEFGVSERRISVVHPGAPKPVRPGVAIREDIRMRYAPKGERLVLAVGRFMPRKGHETLIRAMPAVVERFSDVRLVMVGRGPRLEAARQLVEELGLSDRVSFTGHVSDEELAALYEQCELFALPTGEGPGGQVEGFGLVFSEAHAWGKPVVAGRSGGVADAVLDGDTGIIVEPGDSSATSEALIRLLDNPREAREMGSRGRRRVEEELNWRRFTRRVVALMEPPA